MQNYDYDPKDEQSYSSLFGNTLLGDIQDNDSQPDDRIIVALDLPNIAQGLDLVDRLGDSVNFYKIGLGMLFGRGLPLAEYLKSRGKRVFLDMKFFDIGATVAKTVSSIAQYDLDFLTVHGDPYVIRGAIKGRGESNMKILAVTFLTSLRRSDLDSALIKKSNADLEPLVVERARRAFQAGADGVIASPQEANAIRSLSEAKGKLIVTPGIRPEGAALDDQKRTATPGEAIQNGANHIVIGRPIWAAKNPRDMVAQIKKELDDAKIKKELDYSRRTKELSYPELMFG